MSEIKYKSWATYKDKWFGKKEKLEQTDDCKIALYTGIDDKNGKEIYEHDLIKSHFTEIKTISEVYFSKGSFVADMPLVMSSSNKEPILLSSMDDIEKVGNTFEGVEE